MPAPLVILAKIGKPYALKGWQLLHSYTAPADSVFDYHDWQLQLPGNTDWQPCDIEDMAFQSNKLMIKLADIQSPEQASKLTNSLLAVDRKQLPKLKKGEYYWHDLMGCQVVNLEGEQLGQVDDIFNSGASDILSVVAEDIPKLRLIPYNKQTTQSVDLKTKTITVNWGVNW